MPLNSYNEDSKSDITDQDVLISVLDELVQVIDQINSEIAKVIEDLEKLTGTK